MAEALQYDVPMIALHVTRPRIKTPDRHAFGMPYYFEAAKSAYILKDYHDDRAKDGVVIVRGTKAIDELLTILPKIKSNGPNVKIIAALSHYLFTKQTATYQQMVMSDSEWADSMIITNTAINLMSNWIKHPIVKSYSVSPDWDNRWRSGGTLDDVIDESHLSAHWQLDAIQKFAGDREIRLNQIKSTLPSN